MAWRLVRGSTGDNFALLLKVMRKATRLQTFDLILLQTKTLSISRLLFGILTEYVMLTVFFRCFIELLVFSVKPVDGGSMVLRNFGIQPLHLTSQQFQKTMNCIFLLLSLAPQPKVRLWCPKSSSICPSPTPSQLVAAGSSILPNVLEASQQFSFLQGRVVSPTPKPHSGGPGLCIYIPQRRGGPIIPPGTGYPF
jgi:hypothetical protein